MTCASCVHLIESRIITKPGIISASVALATTKGLFVYETDVTGPRDIIEAIQVCAVLVIRLYVINGHIVLSKNIEIPVQG